jgi:DNA-binding NtrC family response regulator
MKDVAPASVTPAADEPPAHSANSVLLVDDERTILDVAARLLASFGFHVLPARNGEDALRLFGEHQKHIRLALVDLTMPQMSGEVILRELRHRSADLPLVLMSGYPDADVLNRLGELQLAGFLHKPFRLPDMLDLLRQLKLVDR